MTTVRRVARARVTGDGLPPLSAAQYDSFVIRICHRGGVLMHGEVIHVGSRRSRPFRDVKAILNFILANSGEPGEPTGLEPLA